MIVNTDKVIAMAVDRIPPRDIAAKFDVPVDTVYGLIRKARSSGTHIPHFNAGKPEPKLAIVGVDHARVVDVTSYNLVIPNRLHSLLDSEALRRGKTPAELAQHILETALLSGVRPDRTDTINTKFTTENPNV